MSDFKQEFLNDIKMPTGRTLNPVSEKIVVKALTNGQISIPQQVELQRLKTADLSNLASSVKNAVKSSPIQEDQTVVATPKRNGTPCTDCDGGNPCEDCDEPTHDQKSAWIDINIPNQGDPTVAQTLALEEAKRKKTIVYAAIILAIMILLIFAVKFFKKKK